MKLFSLAEGWLKQCEFTAPISGWEGGHAPFLTCKLITLRPFSFHKF
jgi:hypothetical protein